jgi:nicotinamide mononucleotide transporter
MTIQELALQFTTQLQETQPLEAIAVLMGMISVVLANRNHVWLYPTGIISTALYIYIMSSVGLYAESLLNAYYLILSIYGWLLWNRHHENQNPRAISANTSKDWIISFSIVVIGWLILYFSLKTFTNSDVPALDAIVSATAWAGMWLLAKHKIENWILLNISNLIAMPLLIYKGLPLTAALTLFLFIVAIFGYMRWRKQYMQHLKEQR